MSGRGQKQSLYFPIDIIREIEAEARRLDRSMSWVVARAWEAGRAAIQRMPAQSQEMMP